jgi:hypothetical protein
MIDSATFVKDEQGSVFLNETQSAFKGGCLIPTTNPTSCLLAATSQPVALESETDSWSEIIGLIGSFTAGTATQQKTFLTIPKEYRFGERQLCNRPVIAQHVFGSQQKPFMLDTDIKGTNGFGETILLAPTQYLTFQFINPADATVALSILAQRTKIQNKARLSKGVDFQIKNAYERQKQVTPYWFSMDSSFKIDLNIPGVNLAASAVGDVFFTNKENLTLILTSCMASFMTTGVAGETVEGFAFEVFDPVTGGALQSSPVTFNCGVGSGLLPYRLPFPIFVGNRDSVRVRFTNLITDQATQIMFTFFGVAIWNPPGVYQNYGATGDFET